MKKTLLLQCLIWINLKHFCSFSQAFLFMTFSLMMGTATPSGVSSSERQWMENTGQTALLPSRQGEVHQSAWERGEGAACKCLVDLRKKKFISISDTCDKTSESLETGFLFSVSSPGNEFSPISLNVYIETECTSVPKTAAKLQSLSRYVCC